MKRSIAAVVLGFITWVIVVSLLNRLLRVTIEGYAAAEPTLTLNLTMMFWRLIIGAMSSIAAGAVAALISRSATRTPWITGLILLLLFIPQHIYLWHVLPIWYHLTFLLTLVPLFGAGGWLAERAIRRSKRADPFASEASSLIK